MRTGRSRRGARTACTHFHVNRPDWLPSPSAPPSTAPPSSGSKVQLSLRSSTSARSSSVSSRRQRLRASSSGPVAVKSHQPWLLFLPEKRCQESRAKGLSGSPALHTASR